MLDRISSNIIGTGRHYVSAYQADASVTTPELTLRQGITAAVRTHTAEKRLDAGCALTYVELIEQVVLSGFVAGDGFAVHSWVPNRPGCKGYATAWRSVDAARVCNPDSRPNVDCKLVNGIEIRDRLHVRSNDWKTWAKIDWYAPDGSANVFHYAPNAGGRGPCAASASSPRSCAWLPTSHASPGSHRLGAASRWASPPAPAPRPAPSSPRWPRSPRPPVGLSPGRVSPGPRACTTLRHSRSRSRPQPRTPRAASAPDSPSRIYPWRPN
ncbi:MAG: phage portal protein [Planctomycetes bacterium]|nr:phage portal protein [Planctomycetota bacterium]